MTHTQLPKTFGFEIPTAVSIKATVFYKMTSNNFIDEYCSFGETYLSSTLKHTFLIKQVKTASFTNKFYKRVKVKVR